MLFRLFDESQYQPRSFGTGDYIDRYNGKSIYILSFRLESAMMEESEGLAKIIGRGEAVYIILLTKHNTTLSRVDRVGFEQFSLALLPL